MNNLKANRLCGNRNQKNYGSMKMTKIQSSFIPHLLYTDDIISKVESSNQVYGLTVARGAPPISHLLYTDDIMFFSQSKHSRIKHHQNYSG